MMSQNAPYSLSTRYPPPASPPPSVGVPQHPALCPPAAPSPLPPPRLPLALPAPPPPPPQWVSLFDNINREWMEAVQMVLDYFCERTPR